MIFRHKANLVKTREKGLRFALVDHQGGRLTLVPSYPFGPMGAFRPVRVRLIRGKAELLSGMHIVKQIGAAVCFVCGGGGGGRSIQGWAWRMGNDDFRRKSPLGIFPVPNCLRLR